MLEEIERDFKEMIGGEVQIKSEGKERYRIFTPFMFADGDHFSIILKRENDGWVLSDEGCTYMHLSFDQDGIFFDGKNRNTIASELSKFDVQEKHGELTARIHNERYGDALQDFIQAIKATIKGEKK